MTKAFRKAIMKRSEIENKSVKNKASDLYHKKKKKKKKKKKMKMKKNVTDNKNF